MKNTIKSALLCVIVILTGAVVGVAQEKVTVLSNPELSKVVPAGFYFKGLTAQTQMRNAAAAKFSDSQHVIAGLVDTAGYSADVRAKYEGFLICDTPVSINGQALPTGAYGFGFANDGTMSVLDLGGNQVLLVPSSTDKDLKRPRPLMMSSASDGLRLYSGRNYVVIALSK
jgi:hypothetical protein